MRRPLPRPITPFLPTLPSGRVEKSIRIFRGGGAGEDRGVHRTLAPFRRRGPLPSPSLRASRQRGAAIQKPQPVRRSSARSEGGSGVRQKPFLLSSLPPKHPLSPHPPLGGEGRLRSNAKVQWTFARPERPERMRRAEKFALANFGAGAGRKRQQPEPPQTPPSLPTRPWGVRAGCEATQRSGGPLRGPNARSESGGQRNSLSRILGRGLAANGSNPSPPKHRPLSPPSPRGGSKFALANFGAGAGRAQMSSDYRASRAAFISSMIACVSTLTRVTRLMRSTTVAL